MQHPIEAVYRPVTVDREASEGERLWLPAEDGWDFTEWGHDEDRDPESLYSWHRADLLYPEPY